LKFFGYCTYKWPITRSVYRELLVSPANPSPRPTSAVTVVRFMCKRQADFEAHDLTNDSESSNSNFLLVDT
jgi:hypothetical protein